MRSVKQTGDGHRDGWAPNPAGWRDRFAMLVLLLGFKLLLDVAYASVVARDFSYAGYLLEIDRNALNTSYVVIGLWALVLPVRSPNVAPKLFTIVFLLTMLPISTFYPMSGEAPGYFIACNVFFGVMGVIMLLLPPLAVQFSVPHGRWIFIVLAAAFVAATIVMAHRRGGFALATIDIGNVYDVRHAIQDNVLFGPLAYLSSWSGKVILPALLVVGLWMRAWSVAIIALFLSVVVFAVTSAKEMLVFPIGAAIAFYLARSPRLLLWSVLGLIALVAATLLLDRWRGEGDVILVSAIVLQRALFAQAKIGCDYVEFFRDNPHTYWSNAFLSGIVENPYTEPVPMIIGYGSWGSGIEAFANAGVVGSAIMHFGMGGVIGFAVVTAVLFRLVDILARHRMPPNVALAVALPGALQFVNGDLSATLLSHGFAVTLLTLWLIGDGSLKPRKTLQLRSLLARPVTPAASR
ncbi:MAG: hypothetical protein AB7E80_16500 [Hyphomicrobiaceae bacterium]